MRLEIDPLEATAERDVDAVLALLHAAGRVDVPDFPPACPYDLRAALREAVSFRRTERYIARVGDTVVGHLQLLLPRLENREQAELELTVHPGHRRRGVGRALYSMATMRLRELGRKRIIAQTVEAVPGGPARGHAGRAFATALGATPALTEVRRRWDAASADAAALATMQATARAKASGYQVVTWQGVTPEEYAGDVAYLNSRLNSDAPTGQLDWEANRIDAERQLEGEAAAQARGMRLYSAAARHEATGRVVAVTKLTSHRSSPWHAWQWITLVDPPHRGRRLGALVKVANLEFARTSQPELRVIDTWNAAANQHMISINEQMGFHPVDAWVYWQREI